jgi:hypothetical protein
MLKPMTGENLYRKNATEFLLYLEEQLFLREGVTCSKDQAKVTLLIEHLLTRPMDSRYIL